ncbi:hypothetical protein [Microbacterium gilvum]|uniref:Scaffolding protein n=1 Tax=Microbacterium gilvum TaxID=1336204 RepID=A0ABP9A7F2_9MICO
MTDTNETPAEDPQNAPSEPNEDGLGDAGKKAIAAEREARKTAEKAAADYKAQLERIEQANLTELEKAQKRAEAAEKQANDLATKAARAEVAAAKGVPAALLTGTTQEELEASADALIAFRGEPAKGPVVPTQGKTPDKAAPESADDWLRNLAKR